MVAGLLSTPVTISDAAIDDLITVSSTTDRRTDPEVRCKDASAVFFSGDVGGDLKEYCLVSFTTPGEHTWKAPEGIRTQDGSVLIIAGGGGGGGGASGGPGDASGGGGGGGGGGNFMGTLGNNVRLDNEDVLITVGAGGAGGASGQPGQAGTRSCVRYENDAAGNCQITSGMEAGTGGTAGTVVASGAGNPMTEPPNSVMGASSGGAGGAGGSGVTPKAAGGSGAAQTRADADAAGVNGGPGFPWSSLAMFWPAGAPVPDSMSGGGGGGGSCATVNTGAGQGGGETGGRGANSRQTGGSFLAPVSGTFGGGGGGGAGSASSGDCAGAVTTGAKGGDGAVFIRYNAFPIEPDAPVNVRVRDFPLGIGNGQVGIQWDPPSSNGGSEITGYTVTASPDVDGVARTCVTTDLGSGFGPDRACTVMGLTNGVEYTFTVVATNAVGDSVPSQGFTATPAGPPGPPTAVTVTPGDGQALVSWTAPSNDGGSAITRYVVASDPAGAGPTCEAIAPATECVVTGLTNGTKYEFIVIAFNAATSPGLPSASSPEVTPIPVPGSPTAVTATAGDGQASVSWTAPESAGGSAILKYTVTASPEVGGVARTCEANAPATTCDVTGLTNGTAYTFTVVATNSNGDSFPSDASTAVTPAAATTGGSTGGTTGGTTGGSTGGTTGGGTTDSTAGTAPREPVAPTTEPVLGPDGAAPALTPGAGQVVRPGPDGPVVSTPTITTEDGQLVITDGDLTVRLSSTLPLSATGSVVASNDGTLTCTLCGAVAGTTVEAWLFSSPRLVGAGLVDEDGCVELRISLAEPLDGGAAIAPGDHTLQVVIPAAEADTTPTAVNVGMTVTGPVPTSVPSGEGPSAPAGLLLLGVGIALAGAALLRREVLTTIR